MPNAYHVRLNNQEFGPHSREELEYFLSVGQISNETPCRPDGKVGWSSVGEVLAGRNGWSEAKLPPEAKPKAKPALTPKRRRKKRRDTSEPVISRSALVMVFMAIVSFAPIALGLYFLLFTRFAPSGGLLMIAFGVILGIASFSYYMLEARD
jgi:hypothetical protein